MLHIETFVSTTFQENTYLIWDENLNAVVIDPGCYTNSERQELVDAIERKALTLQAIWCTHGHIDHIFGVEFLAKKFNLPIYAHEIAWEEMKRSVEYSGVYGTPIKSVVKPTHFIKEGNTVQLGSETFEVIFTPGHSPGSISFYHATENKLFSGDVLFHEGIGRWDLPGGNYDLLMKTITTKILALPPKTLVYPGHYDTTTIEYEQKRNSYILTYLAKKPS